MSDMQSRARDLGMKWTKCLEMLAWLYEEVLDGSMRCNVAGKKDGFSLTDGGSEIKVKELEACVRRYSVSLVYAGKPVIQCAGIDLAGLVKGMVRTLAENMSAQAMSIFVEEDAQ